MLMQTKLQLNITDYKTEKVLTSFDSDRKLHTSLQSSKKLIKVRV